MHYFVGPGPRRTLISQTGLNIPSVHASPTSASTVKEKSAGLPGGWGRRPVSLTDRHATDTALHLEQWPTGPICPHASPHAQDGRKISCVPGSMLSTILYILYMSYSYLGK